ncbi:MAG: halo-CC-star protein HcsS [Candidatus Woesearchaeota archaeon]
MAADEENNELMRAAEELTALLRQKKDGMDPYKFAELLADCNDLIKRETGIDYGATCSGHGGGCC